MNKKPLNISEEAAVQMPMKTVASLIALVAIGTWAYFGLHETLNRHSTQIELMQKDLVENTEFRIKWPRGQLGSLPADSEQFMMIEDLYKTTDKLNAHIESMALNKVNRNPSLAQNENFALLVSKCRGVIPQAVETEDMPTGSLWDELKEDYIKENPESKTLDNNNSTLKMPPEGYILPKPKPNE